MAQLWLDAPPLWWRIDKFLTPELVAFVDRHYSRQTPGSNQIAPPGETLLLEGERAAWVVAHNFDPGQDDTRRWRCTLFRNEGGHRSSSRIVAATALTFDYWTVRYGYLPSVPLTTEVDANKTRHKRDPGRCFRRAGWELWSIQRGLHVFLAPAERARLSIQGPVLK